MALVLLLEDDLNDIRTAMALARKAGFTEVETQMSSTLAVLRLGNAIEDCEPLPDVLILDLDLGGESGFELLRFIHTNRLMAKLRVVVWTVMGEREREICRLFGIRDFVSKYDGPNALFEVLYRINHTQTGAATVQDAGRLS
jgi:CheY-like chemotaxis protein